MNLDELHKVMKGDMTVDQACEGMTDDFEIGHVSHRADGDYRKVAQGKWVPVKAGGGQQGEKPEQTYNGYRYKGKNIIKTQAHGYPAYRIEGEKEISYRLKDVLTKIDKAAGVAREFSETENHGAQLERQKKADAQTKKDEAVREQRAQGEAVGKSWKTAAEEWIKKNPNYKEMSADDIIKGISEHIAASEKPAELKMTNALKDIINAGKADEYFSESNEDGAKRMLREDYGLSESETNKIYEQLRIMHNAKIDEENEQKADADAGRERRYNNERYGVNEKPAEQQGGGTNPAYKTFEENYAEATFGKNEAEKMGWKMADVGTYPFWDSPDGKYRISAQHTAKEGGFEYELREKDTGRTIGRYPSLLDALRKKTTDSAPARLTRDTKIRLSRIKREVTEDKKYNVGEISQKTGLQKQQDGSWAPPKQGRGSAYQEADKKVEALRGRGFNRTHLKNMRPSELDKLYEREMGAPAGGKTEVNPITGKPLRPETVAYAQQKKAEAEQKRNTEKTAGGFTLAQNDKIKNAALDVITKRRGERLTAKNLKRDYKMSDEEANETVRRVNEYFENLQKDRKEFSKR